MINPGSTIRILGLALMLMAVSMSVHAQQQRVEVQLSANRVSADETVILNVRAYSLDEELITSALDKDFEVTQRSSSRQVTVENGKSTVLVEWVLELLPKRAGLLEVPPVFVGPEQSLPLTLLVEQPASGANRDMYLEATVDITDPYVQAQVIYTLRVFQDVRFLEATLKVPEVEGVRMQQLSEEKNYQETVDGRTYGVSEIRYAVFPQQSGTVIIPPLTLQAVIAVDPNQVPNTRTRTRRIKRQANEIELNVQARPDGMAGSWWLPAKAVTLQSEWSSPINALTVDQPVTRTVRLTATGAGETQLPEIEAPELDNISVYADSPTAATDTSEVGVVSQQTNTWAVIPQVAGQLVLPEVKVNWFDTTTGEAKVATLPAETLIVSSAAANPQGNAAAAPKLQESVIANQLEPSNNANDSDALAENSATGSQADTDPVSQEVEEDDSAMSQAVNAAALHSENRWRNIAAALLVGWIVSLLGLWMWMRKRSSVNQSHAANEQISGESSTKRFQRRAGSRAALDPIKEACDTENASKISQEVLSWANMVWPENPPTHISKVAARLNSNELAQAFDAIDAQQYHPAGSVNTTSVEQIPSLIKTAIDQYQTVESVASAKNALPGL